MPLTSLTSCPNCGKSCTNETLICKHCMQLILRITFQPKQREMFDLFRKTGPNVATKLGFGGSRGSAKSRFGRDLALACCRLYPGATVFIVARNFSNLDENYVEKYRLERPEMMRYFHASAPSEFAFPADLDGLGGSRIAFRYGDTVKDITQLERGPEALLVIVEQAEQFSEKELQQLNTPNRWPNAEPGAAKTVYLFNPGGPGSSYLQRVFYLKQYQGTEKPSDFAFIQTFGWDNWAWFQNECPDIPDADAFYRLHGEIPPCPSGRYDSEWLAAVPDHYRFKIFVNRTSEGRKMWAKPESIRMGDLFGRFDAFAGQYFAGVWNERLIVINEATVDGLSQYWWPIWLSGDWGFGHNAAFYWFCTGKISPTQAWDWLQIDTEWPLDIVIVYREYVPPQRTAEPDLGKGLVERTPKAEREALQRWVMGSDVNTQPRFSEHTIKEMIEAVTEPAGMPRIRNANCGKDTRVNNARMCYEMLRRTCSMRSEVPLRDRPDDKTAPLMLISAECPVLIKAIPSLITDEDKPEDVKKLVTVDDDAFDAWKYGCAEYLDVRNAAPREVRRAEAMDRAGGDSAEAVNTQRYLNMLKFDHEEQMGERRGKRR